jgi:hypothetical protein
MVSPSARVRQDARDQWLKGGRELASVTRTSITTQKPPDGSAFKTEPFSRRAEGNRIGAPPGSRRPRPTNE